MCASVSVKQCISGRKKKPGAPWHLHYAALFSGEFCAPWQPKCFRRFSNMTITVWGRDMFYRCLDITRITCSSVDLEHFSNSWGNYNLYKYHQIFLKIHSKKNLGALKRLKLQRDFIYHVQSLDTYRTPLISVSVSLCLSKSHPLYYTSWLD